MLVRFIDSRTKGEEGGRVETGGSKANALMRKRSFDLYIHTHTVRRIINIYDGNAVGGYQLASNDTSCCFIL